MKIKAIRMALVGMLFLLLAGFVVANAEVKGGIWINDSAVKFVGLTETVNPTTNQPLKRASYEFWVDVDNEEDVPLAVDLMAIFMDWHKEVVYTKWKHYTTLIPPETIMRFEGTFSLPQDAPDKVENVDWMLRLSGTGDYPKWKFTPEQYMRWNLLKEMKKDLENGRGW
jgi:hypothetical protein